MPRDPQAPKALSTPEIFIALHRLHFSRTVIAELTGFTSSYVGQVLAAAKTGERWNHVADARADLPSDLRNSCDALLRANAGGPIGRRRAAAIARHHEIGALLEAAVRQAGLSTGESI